MQTAFTTPQTFLRHGLRNVTSTFITHLCRSSPLHRNRDVLFFPFPTRHLFQSSSPVSTTAETATTENITSKTHHKQSQIATASASSPSPLPLSTSMRTHTCGQLRENHVGQLVKLSGWAHAVRDKGGVIFILLRDRHGIIQTTVTDQTTDSQVIEAAKAVRLEYVVSIHGTVALRDSSAINSNMSTGNVEIIVSHLNILSRTKPLPFMISDQSTATESSKKKPKKDSTSSSPTGANEDTRLKYRYLDLRRPSLQHNFIIRHKATLAIRNYLNDSNFIEVETPILTKATPEGARDYLVPSRVHPGSWYALPQSPQLYKQLLMVSGFDRYFQISRCFRDEDLRIDRQPEFTQIDLELSFIDRSSIMQVAYGIVHSMFKANDLSHFIPNEFPMLSYHDAIEKYGVDNPDLRFDMCLCDLSQLDVMKKSEFAPVKTALNDEMRECGIVKGFVVKAAAKGTSRKVIDGYTAFVKEYGLSGLLYGKVEPDGLSVTGPLSKICTEKEGIASLLSTNGLNAEAGDLLLVACGQKTKVNTGLGRLRVKIGHESGLISKGPKYAFCWIVDFPLFEYDEKAERYTSVHHPFTSPLISQIHMLDNTDNLENILSDSYDLVCNGSEIGGGSLRIHEHEVQKRVFSALGIEREEQDEKFGFLLDALAFGAPPHGGMAFGLDRCVMIMAGVDSIRDVVAFPKTTSASDLMAGAPAPVPKEQLDELSVESTFSENEEDEDLEGKGVINNDRP